MSTADEESDCAAELGPLIAGARVSNGERKVGADGTLPGQEQLPNVDIAPPPPPMVEMDVTPPTSGDNVWTWASLLFERAKALGIAEPVFELRMLKTNQATISGYFSDVKQLTLMVMAQNQATGKSRRQALYCTVNPCSPELLARATNRCESYAQHTTADADIVRRIILPIDFDPNRPAGISSTNAEHDAAIDRARRVRNFLVGELQWPEPVIADSGNGAHLTFGIDLQNDADSLSLVNRCLAALQARFGDSPSKKSDGGVAVDSAVGNAARIWKVPGTHARKGDHSASRPHRMARILSMPVTLATVPREQLERLGALVATPTNLPTRVNGAKPAKGVALPPVKSSTALKTKTKGVHEPDLDVPAWLKQHGLTLTKQKPYGDDGGTLWELECCPMDPAHSNNSACVIKFATGVVTAKCHHNSCSGLGWREWLEKVGDPLPERKRVANPYTEAEIATFAAQQGCTVEEFQLRWMIQRETAYFIFSDGHYLSPLLKSELAAALEKRDLARVPTSEQSPAGIDWCEQSVGEDGPVEKRHKGVDEMIGQYATVARKIVASMMEAFSKYDPLTQIFYEAACPLRPIAPAYDERIDKWLRLLGGKDSEKLLDWVATATRLDRVTCGVYLHGPKDFGKNMFAEGLARLWGNAATELRSLTGNFNSALLNSPLVFADEEVPANMTSGFLRSLVGSSSRALKRKFMPEAELLGAIRLVIAANNPDLLKFDDEDFSEEDIKAVAARILYIRPDPTTAEYVRSIGGRTGTQGWVEGGDKIAAHALWLRDNRAVKAGSRFLVEGEIDTIHRRLMTHGSIRGLVIEWVAKAMLETNWQAHPGILFGGGKLYVNASFVKSTWERILGDKRPPSLKKIGMALKPIAQGERRMKLSNRRADFYDLQLEPIYEAMRELQVGAIEHYRKLVETPKAYLDATDADDPSPNQPPQTPPRSIAQDLAGLFERTS